MTETAWHRDFPADAREMWDILAKALMIRAGGSVSISAEEYRAAAATQAEVTLKNGTVEFRVGRQ
jgi:hypothetical protein